MDFSKCTRKGFSINASEDEKKKDEAYFLNGTDEVWTRFILLHEKPKPVEIRLKNGSSNEIDFALCLVEDAKWISLYCKGRSIFLNEIAQKVFPIPGNFPSLQILNFLIDESGENAGFSTSEDFGPQPRWKSSNKSNNPKDEPEAEEPEEEQDIGLNFSR